MIAIWSILAIILVFGLVVFRGAPYVPSRKPQLDKAFTDLYRLGPSDCLVDIGSGDGVVLRAAARRKARAVGYELNPILVMISRWLSRRQKGVKTYWADFWQTNWPDETTVVYVFGESRDIARMAEKVASQSQRLQKPLYLISYGFAVPDRQPLKTLGAYYLYRFDYLLIDKA